MLTDHHLHTTISDGQLSPLELVEQVARVGVQRFAITDHDAVGAYSHDVLARVQALGLTLDTGIELDVSDGPMELHLLGFGFRLDDRPLRKHLATVQEQRRTRAQEQLKGVQALLGPDSVSIEEALPDTVDTVMKPHIIHALLSRKLFANYREAKKWLKENVPDGVELTRPTIQEGIALLQGAGASAVLAHPGYYCKDHGLDITAYLEKLKGYGLDGVEAHYPYGLKDRDLFTDQDIQSLFDAIMACAQRLGLQTTRGSDSHTLSDIDKMYAAGAVW